MQVTLSYIARYFWCQNVEVPIEWLNPRNPHVKHGDHLCRSSGEFACEEKASTDL